MAEHGLELTLRHDAQEPCRDAEVARLRAEACRERVRRRIVDDADLGGHGKTRCDRHVLDEAPQRPQLVRLELDRVGHARDHPARGDHREDRVQAGSEERDDAEPQVERRADEPGDDSEQQDEADDDDAAPQAVPADLLLKRHVAGVNETCGSAVSPSAEKYSFSPKPSGRATSTHGRLWMPLL